MTSRIVDRPRDYPIGPNAWVTRSHGATTNLPIAGLRLCYNPAVNVLVMI